MPYFADLTPHAYTRLSGVNVGWLDPAHPHPIGPALPTFLGALRAERGTVPLPPAAPDAVCLWTPHLYSGTIYEGELVRPTLGILYSRRRKPRFVAQKACEDLSYSRPKTGASASDY